MGLRILAGVYSVAVFIAGAALALPLAHPAAAMVFAGGLVAYLIATFALLNMHRGDGRPAWEAAAAALFPALLWFTLTGPEGRAARPFLVFAGAFHLAATGGGLLLGLLLSPVFAVREGLPADTARAGLRFGLAWLRRFRAGTWAALALFLVAGAAIAWMAARAAALCGLAARPAPVRGAMALALAVALATVIRLTYRHTLFARLAASSPTAPGGTPER